MFIKLTVYSFNRLWERISKEIKTILIKLKLHRLYSAIILKYDEDTFKILNLIEAYITWGYLNKNTIKELIYKRGAYLNNDQDVVTLDNTIVEAHLGKYNLLCLDDLVYELSTGGKRFNEINNFLG